MRRFRRRRLPPSIRIRFRRWSGLAFTLLVVIAAAVVVSQRTLNPPRPAPHTIGATSDDLARYHDRSFRVVHVVDGDTLDIDEPDGGKSVTRIRLWGVDTPEIAHGRERTMYFGPEAKVFAEEELEGHDVWIVLAANDTRDKFGRLLAYVFLERGGAMFNELLLERGYAYADPRFDHPYDDEFEDVEKRAQRGGAGLWRGVTPRDMPAWRQRKTRATGFSPRDDP